MFVIFRKTLLLVILCMNLVILPAQNMQHRITKWLQTYDSICPSGKQPQLERLRLSPHTHQCRIYLNKNFANIPVRPELLQRMQNELKKIIGKKYQIDIYIGNQLINDLIPNYYRETHIRDLNRLAPSNVQTAPLTQNLSRPYTITQGLQGRHIALWNSHGWYYEAKLDRWEWQRARLLQTVEDKLTTAYVLDYLLPMLENAGANVLLPRERDTQCHEIVVDNDGSSSEANYIEYGKRFLFIKNNAAGFGWHAEAYIDSANPFREGTCVAMRTDTLGSATVVWQPTFPVSGYYAVSVAYHSQEKSTVARYMVQHAAGNTYIDVNQTIGGGTWVYLGTFFFKKGLHEDGKVVLSNWSKDKKHIITADAVRFGGGMGNVARYADNDIGATDTLATDIDKHNRYMLSNKPRYLEGARYWMQWAGIPYGVYSPTHGHNDYIDDYAGRGYWVNYLQSSLQPAINDSGLHIPIDAVLAFHTDAGCERDSIIGTLGIFTAKTETDTFINGQLRYASRDLTDLVMTSIVDDVRRQYEPRWTRRELMNKNYAETRLPETPSMILELLAHQNFTDMQYGLDPRFQFCVARAVYKGLLRFVASQNSLSFTVQPLPVSHFALQLSNDSVRLSWHAVIDTLEPTATPTAYVIYTRRDNGGFDNGIRAHDTCITLPLPANTVMSYRITAINAGGESFPSETLTACRIPNSKRTALIINGFTRISGPESFEAADYAGFPEWLDHGVPYHRNLAYTGLQYNFDRRHPWRDDDAPGFGASAGTSDSTWVAGNTFDYPLVHGSALQKVGYSFVSCSTSAVEAGSVNLTKFDMVDWILGEQRSVGIGTRDSMLTFKTFTRSMQRIIAAYCAQGGALFVSGAHVGSDAWKFAPDKKGQQFAQDILKFTWRCNHAAHTGGLYGIRTPFKGKFDFCTQPNPYQYDVEAPDGIEPADTKARTIMRYTENNISAAIAYSGHYRVVVCGFPFEALTDVLQQTKLMQQITTFLLPQ